MQSSIFEKEKFRFRFSHLFMNCAGLLYYTHTDTHTNLAVLFNEFEEISAGQNVHLYEKNAIILFETEK